MPGLMIWLVSNWKWIAIGVGILAAVSYVKILHMEVSHYKNQVVAVKAEFAAYRSNAEAMHESMKSSNAALTLKLKENEVARNKAGEDFQKALKERIKNDKASSSVVIPNSAVRLFNETTSEPNSRQSTSTNGVDDEKADLATTLTDVLQTSADNNANHWECIHQVEDWQEMWKGFVTNVQAAKALGG